MREPLYFCIDLERCLSGRKSSPRKRVALQGARGFESHSLRQLPTVPKDQTGSRAAETPEPCQVLTEAALRETFRVTRGNLVWFLVTVGKNLSVSGLYPVLYEMRSSPFFASNGSSFGDSCRFFRSFVVEQESCSERGI